MNRLLNTLVFAVLCTGSGGQTVGPSPVPSIRELQQRHLLVPEQAMQKVRQITGENTASVELRCFIEDEDIRYEGTRYFYQIKQGHRAGDYIVSAYDGQLLDYEPVNKGTECTTDQPVLSLVEAQDAAERFLHTNYLGFTQAQWELAPLKLLEAQLPQTYWLHYHRIINPQTGARLELPSVEIEVNATDGTIERFRRMPDYPYNGPSVPRVSREQAIQIASQFAPCDVNLVPFDSITLDIYYDMYQIPSLTWHIHQPPPPTFDSRYNSPGYMSVDAMTGTFSPGPAAFGGGGFGDVDYSGKRKPNPKIARYLNKNVKPLPPSPARIAICKAGDKPLTHGDDITVQGGQVWIRAELLRALDAQVQADPKTLRVTFAGYNLTGAGVGAKYHDYGWWVPLRRVVEAAGGHVTWNAAAKEAVVDVIKTTPVASNGNNAPAQPVPPPARP